MKMHRLGSLMEADFGVAVRDEPQNRERRAAFFAQMRARSLAADGLEPLPVVLEMPRRWQPRRINIAGLVLAAALLTVMVIVGALIAGWMCSCFVPPATPHAPAIEFHPDPAPVVALPTEDRA